MSDIVNSISEAVLRSAITKQHISDLYTQLESGIEIPDEPMVTLLRLHQRSTLLKAEIETLTRATAKSEHVAQGTKLESGLVLPSEAVGLETSWAEARSRRKSLKQSWYATLAASETPALAVAEVFSLELESQANALESAILALIEPWPFEASAGSAPTILRLCATLIREGAAGRFVPPGKRVYWLNLSNFENLLAQA